MSCFGAGFVGLPTSCVLALNNPDVDVTGASNLVLGVRHRPKENIDLQIRKNASILT